MSEVGLVYRIFYKNNPRLQEAKVLELVWTQKQWLWNLEKGIAIQL